MKKKSRTKKLRVKLSNSIIHFEEQAEWKDFTTLKCGFPKLKMRSDIKKLEKKKC